MKKRFKQMNTLDKLPIDSEYSDTTIELIKAYNQGYKDYSKAKEELAIAQTALNSEYGLNVKPVQNLAKYVAIERTYPQKINRLEYQARKSLDAAIKAILPLMLAKAQTQINLNKKCSTFAVLSNHIIRQKGVKYSNMAIGKNCCKSLI